MENIPREHRLHHIGTIQTVHTVGADYTLLAILTGVVANACIVLAFDMEITVVAELSGNMVDQSCKVLVLQVLTLIVEVEPDVLQGAVTQAIDKFLKLLAKHLLGPLLINKVNEAYILVPLLQILNMHTAELAVDSIVAYDVAFRRPLQVWFLLPFERH